MLRSDPGTARLISQCADYQRDMLAPRSPIPPDQFGTIPLLAKILRCIVMAQDQMDVELNYTRLDFRDGSEVVEMQLEEDSDVTD